MLKIFGHGIKKYSVVLRCIICTALISSVIFGCGCSGNGNGNNVSDTSPTADGSSQNKETELPEATDVPAASGFELHFIDVGQGDCMLLIADGEAMLIDSGNVGLGDPVVNI